MVRVKICGITSMSDARSAVSAGADALGFNFYKKSPRRVDPGRAAFIVRSLPASVVKVGLFVDAGAAEIRRIFLKCGLSAVQLQGGETPVQAAGLGLPCIKAFRVRSRADIAGADGYRGCTYLFDGFDRSSPGGTGRGFDWSYLVGKRPLSPFFLAGGLDPDNVAAAIGIVRPFGVDVCSGVEKAPGVKDSELVRRFIRLAKGAA